MLDAGDSVHALSHAQMCQNQHMEVSNGSPHTNVQRSTGGGAIACRIAMSGKGPA